MQKWVRLQRIFLVLSILWIGALAFHARRVLQDGSPDPLLVAGPLLGLVASVGNLAIARHQLRRLDPTTGTLRPGAAAERAE